MRVAPQIMSGVYATIELVAQILRGTRNSGGFPQSAHKLREARRDLYIDIVGSELFE